MFKPPMLYSVSAHLIDNIIIGRFCMSFLGGQGFVLIRAKEENVGLG